MKRKKNGTIKRKMYFTLIIPYFLIGIIGAGYLGYMYLHSYRLQYDEIRQEESPELERLSRNMESYLTDADRIAIEINMNTRLSASRFADSASADYSYNKAMAVRALASITNFNSAILDTIVYYEAADLYIDQNAARSFYTFCTSYSIPEEYREETESLFSASCPSGKLTALGNPGSKLFYIRSISHYKEGDTVNVITQLNISNIRINAAAEEKRILCIFSADDNSLVYTSDLERYRSVCETPDSFISVIRDDEERGLVYYSYVPSSLLRQNLSVLILTYIDIAAGFALLIITGLFSVRRNYRKIEELMFRISDLYKGGNQPDTEIGYLNQALSYLDNVLRKQGIVVTEDAIKKALYGMMAKDDDIYTWLVEERGLFQHGSSILILLDREDEDVDDAKLNLFILDNVFHEIFENVIYCGVIPVLQFYIVVINWDSTEERNEDWILEQVDFMMDFIKKRFRKDLTIAVSSPKKSILELDEAYREALIALAERQVIGKGQVIYYGNLQDRDSRNDLDEAWKNHLRNNILAGNAEQVQELFTSVYQDFFRNQRLTIESGKIIFFEISLLLQQISADTGVEITLPIEEIFSSSYTAESYLKKLGEAATALCQSGKSRKIEVNEGKIQEIQHWIEMHYTDSNLSVSMLAEHFHLNMTYLSRAYKERTGGNLLNYIMTCRVKKAEELLVSTRDSIPVIAEKTGFTNAASFSRVFKKMIGITPGRFREINQP